MVHAEGVVDRDLDETADVLDGAKPVEVVGTCHRTLASMAESAHASGLSRGLSIARVVGPTEVASTIGAMPQGSPSARVPRHRRRITCSLEVIIKFVPVGLPGLPPLIGVVGNPSFFWGHQKRRFATRAKRPSFRIAVLLV